MLLKPSVLHRTLSTLLLPVMLLSSTGYTHGASTSHDTTRTMEQHDGIVTTNDDVNSVAAATQPLPLPTYDPTKVANPSITVSAGPTAIGRLGGHFSVDATGTATYALPLDVVQGSGGFQPQLAITYNSGSGNGQLGVGFALAGLPVIARCAKTVADDSVTKGVQLDQSDNFCLNGLKLVAVHGTYGAAGTEYRTVPDTHVKVISNGGAPHTTGPAYFEVRTPDGISQFYGGDPWGTLDPISLRLTAGV